MTDIDQSFGARVTPVPRPQVRDLPFAAAGWGYDKLPSRAYPDDAGLDLYVTQAKFIRPGGFEDIHCGLAVELPPGVWGLVIGRSSTIRRRGLMVNPGIIDTGYRGELFTGVWNLSDKPVAVEVGERLAQLILFRNVTLEFRPVEVERLGSSGRGDLGFGSSGQ